MLTSVIYYNEIGTVAASGHFRELFDHLSDVICLTFIMITVLGSLSPPYVTQTILSSFLVSFIAGPI